MQYFVTNSRSAHVSAPTTPVPSLHRVPLVRTILRGPRIQSQLVIGAVNDPAEREADQVVDHVMRMTQPEPGDPGSAAREGHCAECARPVSLAHAAPAVQRVSLASQGGDDAVVGAERTDATPVPEEEEQEQGASMALRRDTTRADAGEPGASVMATVAERLRARRGQGAPLAPPLRRFMEGRFGVDFGSVHIHADGEAADLARTVRAHAFTLDRDVYFAPGAYRPETVGGGRLIAHELAHVVQQTSGQHWVTSPASSPSSTLWRMSDAVELVQQDVYHFGTAGADYHARTDKGTKVRAWKPYAPWSVPYQSQYWCHGLTFGTFYRFGYSVYSTEADVRNILDDEWTFLPLSGLANPGDIAVWWDPYHKDREGRFQPGYSHSAIFRQIAQKENGDLDEDKTLLESKNDGQAHEIATLRKLNGDWPVERRGGALFAYQRGGGVRISPGSDLVGLKRDDGITYGTWDLRPRVKHLQTKLNLHGALLNVDGMFGNKTVAALQQFQARIPLDQTDYVDQDTANALETYTTPPGQPTAISPIEGLQLNDGITYGTWDRRPRVIELQRRLTEAGFACEADGMFGPATAQALHDFQALHSLAQSDVVYHETADLLEGRTGGQPQPEGEISWVA